MAEFPRVRMRRFRRTGASRALVRETRLSAEQFVAPLFVRRGKGLREEISSLPGVFRLSPDEALAAAQELASAGVGAVILFGIPDRKDEAGSEAWDDGGAVQETVRGLKKGAPGLVVMTDVCLDEYTSHGHCGVLTDGEVDNDATLPLLARIAVSHARAGADVVAPSDMMDGRVGEIRRALDAGASRSSPSWRMPRRRRPPFTGRSAKRPARRRSSATAGATRWIRQTAARRCARSRSTSRKGRMPSWSSPPWPTST